VGSRAPSAKVLIRKRLMNMSALVGTIRAPAIGAPRNVRRSEPLADEALAAEPAGVLEDLGAVAAQMLAELDAGAGISQNILQVSLSNFDGAPTQVLAVELEQIEGVEDAPGFNAAAMPQQIEHG
jgi:hypothetical protein